METFFRALEPYQRFDPLGWVSLFRFFPMWAGWLLVGLGGLMMLWGGGRLFRLIAGPLGAAVGFLWTPYIANKLGFAPQAAQARIIATIAIGGLGLGWPPGGTFFALGVPLGMVAGEMAGPNDWMLGFFPGLLVGGALAVAAHRYIGAVTSSLVGAWIAILGLLSGLHPFTSMVESVAQQPWGVLIAAVLFGVAGTVYQLFVRLSPEARLAHKLEREKLKKKLKESKALEKRWTNYSKEKE